MVVLGVTFIEAVVAPVFQRYVPPPADGVAVNVALVPSQTVAEFIVTVGIGFTVRVPEPAKLGHPFKVYTHVYVVVEPGVTVIEAVVAPVFHKYVPPPVEGVAVKVALVPSQTVSELIVTVGIGFTVTVPDPAKLGHPFNV